MRIQISAINYLIHLYISHIYVFNKLRLLFILHDRHLCCNFLDWFDFLIICLSVQFDLVKKNLKCLHLYIYNTPP